MGHVYLPTISRMFPGISGFHRVEVPTICEGGDGRDAVYDLYHCRVDRLY